MTTNPWTIQIVPTNLQRFISLLHKPKLRTQKTNKETPVVIEKRNSIVTTNKQQNLINKKKERKKRYQSDRARKRKSGFIVSGLEKRRWWTHWKRNDSENGQSTEKQEQEEYRGCLLWNRIGSINDLLFDFKDRGRKKEEIQKDRGARWWWKEEKCEGEKGFLKIN